MAALVSRVTSKGIPRASTYCTRFALELPPLCVSPFVFSPRSRKEKKMELKKLVIFLISASLLAFFAEAICVPRSSSSESLGPTPAASAPEVQASPSAAPAVDDYQSLPTQSPSFAPVQSPATGALEGSLSSSLLGLSAGQLPSIFINPAIEQICGATDHPKECLTSVTPFLSGAQDVIGVLKSEIEALKAGFQNATAQASKMMKDPSTSAGIKSCLDTCLEVYDNGLYDLDDASNAIVNQDAGKLKTLLSAMLSYASTCEDAFAEQAGGESPMKDMDDQLEKLASNNLAITSLLHW